MSEITTIGLDLAKNVFQSHGGPLAYIKRFCKRQQMRWSKTGAHLMLQTRTSDGTLRKKFQRWYPV